MKAILKLKNKKIILDWEFGYSKVPYYIKTNNMSIGYIKTIKTVNQKYSC